MVKEMLTQARLKELFTYEPETGKFKSNRQTNLANIGDEIGYYSNDVPYLRVDINYKTYLSHRLAFLYMNNINPSELVDHIDRNTLNNKWGNLRLASKSENNRNRKVLSSSITGIKGLSFKDGKWPRYQAHVTIGKRRMSKSINLRNRDEEEVKKELIAWIKETRERLHGEFTNHG